MDTSEFIAIKWCSDDAALTSRAEEAEKLTLNYRTTEEIRQFASSLLDAVRVDDLDAGQDDSKDYMSLISGNQPNIHAFTSFDDEIRYISDAIFELRDQGAKPA